MRYARGEEAFNKVGRRSKQNRQFARLSTTPKIVDEGGVLVECPFLAAQSPHANG